MRSTRVPRPVGRAPKYFQGIHSRDIQFKLNCRSHLPLTSYTSAAFEKVLTVDALVTSSMFIDRSTTQVRRCCWVLTASKLHRSRSWETPYFWISSKSSDSSSLNKTFTDKRKLHSINGKMNTRRVVFFTNHQGIALANWEAVFSPTSFHYIQRKFIHEKPNSASIFMGVSFRG